MVKRSVMALGILGLVCAMAAPAANAAVLWQPDLSKGKLEVVGSGPFGGFKGPRKPGEMQEEIRQATQEAPAAIDRQRLPPAARKMARGYFEKVRGPEKDAKPK